MSNLFNKNDQVYFTAYLKADKHKFYICRGIVEDTPEQGKRPQYKVKVMAVGDRPIGGGMVVEQASLLGRTITKTPNELTKECSPFMKPPTWIEFKPDNR